MDLKRYATLKEKVVANVSKVIVGKGREIELLLVTFLAGGHLMLEDIKYLAPQVLNHRIVARDATTLSKARELIEGIMGTVPVPLENMQS